MTSTIISWALTLSLIGVGVYYYKPEVFHSIKSSSASIPSTQFEHTTRPPNKRSKSKKTPASKATEYNNGSAASGSKEGQSGKKRKIGAAPGSGGPATSQETATTAEDATSPRNDGNLADKEFAQQLARTQAGTTLQKSEKQKVAKKSKALKHSQAAQLESPEASTATSSTAGRDADDDQSPEDSPQIQANEGPSKAGDISDMLEAPAARPTTLRLTGISDDNKSKKKPAPQPFEQVLTKKQRQAQAKKEELRQMKEESDRIHEAKKQEQLRKARMAAGTSNQTKANNFSGGSTNAWQSSKGSAPAKAAPSTPSAPLLDTFEPSSNNVSQPHGAVHTTTLASTKTNGATDLRNEIGAARAEAVSASSREALQHTDDVLAGHISEEDQMQLLKEQQAEDAWESVTSKKSKKKSKPEEQEASVPAYQPVSAPKAQANGMRSSKIPSRPDAETVNRFGSFQASSDKLTDAEWEA